MLHLHALSRPSGDSRMPQVVGHRGAAGHAPENTLLSFRTAIELGCRAVEMDAHLSKDGEVVVIHDAKVDRVTDGRGLVRKMTVAELQSLRLANGQHLPTLREVIELCKGKVQMHIELKARGTAEPVAALVREYGIEAEVAILSFKISLLKRIKRFNPRLRVTYLFLRKPLRLWSLVRRIPIDTIGPRMRLATAKLVRKAHSLGCKVYVHVVNDPKAAERMAAIRVDSFCTDVPKLFRPRTTRRRHSA